MIRRVYTHQQKIVDGFTKRYHISQLVYMEQFNDIKQAIHREKCIKKWKRTWKIRLIEEQNPNWRNLYNHLF